VHPLSLKYLEQRGIDIHGLKSQSWDEFEAFAPDIVVTVCDSAAQELCPIWFGDSIKVHWGLADPSKLTGTDEEIATAFHNTISEIERRVLALLKANIDATKADETQRNLAQLVSETENSA
jgi:arsenate reductase